MKKVLLSLLASVALFGASNSAHAGVETWNCQLDGDVAGIKLGFIIDGQFLKGEGVVSCVEETDPSNRVEVPVKITLVGGGVGFDFTIVRNVRVVSVGIGNLGGPESLMGSWKVGATAGLQLIEAGISADAAISLRKDNGIGFELGFQGEDAIGLGARLNGMVMRVKPMRMRR